MSPLYERQYHAAQTILSLLRALEPLGALQSVYQAAEEVVRDLGPHQRDKRNVPMPTVYWEITCSGCGAEVSCFSVLCSWPQGGHYVSGNRMMCKPCLTKGELT